MKTSEIEKRSLLKGKAMTLRERMTEIIERLNEGIHEREEIVAVSFLAALCDQNIFLFGPPGTAKSLIARRISRAFETRSYFEYLMHRFSTPEDVFGPVSITELKKDNFVRKTEGFLPRSDFTFLDEIWKSSPSILNALLTIINEKRFRNGTKVEDAPLKALIAASNETPPPDQGLDALYDRFLVRLNVSPMTNVPNFNVLLKSRPTRSKVSLPAGLVIKHEEWEKWGEQLHEVNLSEEVLCVIREIKLAFEEKGKQLGVYVSDRRWQRAAVLLKAAAFFCGRNEANLIDSLLLRHCLWTKKENHKNVVEIVENTVRNHGFKTGFSLHEIDTEKEELEKDIEKQLFHKTKVYKTSKVGNEKCFTCKRKRPSYSNGQYETFYIPASKVKSREDFYPLDQNGNKLDHIKCNFNGQDICHIEMARNSYSYNRFEEVKSFSPTVLHKEGAPIEGVPTRVIEYLLSDVDKLSRKLDMNKEKVEARKRELMKAIETPFVPEVTRKIALEGIDSQIKELKLMRMSCDKLGVRVRERE